MYTAGTHPLYERLETSADCPHPGVQTCAKVFFDALKALVKNDQHGVSLKKSGEYFRTALALSNPQRNITREDEDNAFPGAILFAKTIARMLNSCSDMQNPAQQFIDFLDGKPFNHVNILRFISTLHVDMLDQRKVATVYALELSSYNLS